MNTATEPYYTAAGHWMPSYPGRICVQCGSTFTAHRKTQELCSRACVGANRSATTPEKTKPCARCGKPFVVRNGRGQSRNRAAAYCSRRCVLKAHGWKPSLLRKCAQCDEEFKVSMARIDEGKGKFCSKKCAALAASASRRVKECANCGKPFDVPPSKLNQVVCSCRCRSEYYSRDRASAWQGGVTPQNNRPYRRIDRSGYVAKYEGEHRLIVEREIGRNLRRGEVVVCLDGDNSNLSPSNLFLCPNQTEWGRLREGAVQWPIESNLKGYRSKGYIRPDVILVLHHWENGKRRNEAMNRFITRHPQADEIIKRRKAGATLRQLAADFGVSVSTMGETLRTRL